MDNLCDMVNTIIKNDIYKIKQNVKSVLIRTPLKYNREGKLEPLIVDDKNGDPVMLPAPVYIHLLILSMQHPKFKFNYGLYYIEKVYEMAGAIPCHGILSLKYVKEKKISEAPSASSASSASSAPRVLSPIEKFALRNKLTIDIKPEEYIEKTGIFLKSKREGDYSEIRDLDPEDEDVKEKFINPFLEVYNKRNCYFISLGLYLEYADTAHANTLLIFKHPKQNKINLMLYEPHGETYFSKHPNRIKEITKLKNDLLEFISKIIINSYRGKDVNPPEIIKVDHTPSTCRKGLQANIKNDIGYCTMISSLWLYIILKIMKDISKDEEKMTNFFDEINLIESCIIEGKYKDVINDLVINFSYNLLTTYFNEYITPKSINTSSGESKSDYEIILDFFKENYEQFIKTHKINIISEPYSQREETRTPKHRPVIGSGSTSRSVKPRIKT